MFKGKKNGKIIELVKNHPILYDDEHPEFKNTFKKNKLWKQLGAKINMTGIDMKQKWKNLRDSYSKYLKNVIAATRGDSPAGRNVTWIWASDMDFMKEHMELGSDLPQMEPIPVSSAELFDTQPESEPEINETQVTHKGHTVSELKPISIVKGSEKTITDELVPSTDKVISYMRVKENKLSEQLSPIEHIMMGYAKTIERFSERRKIMTKMKIAQIMMEAELEEELEGGSGSAKRSRMRANTSSREARTKNSTSEQNPLLFVTDNEVKIEMIDEVSD